MKKRGLLGDKCFVPELPWPLTTAPFAGLDQAEFIAKVGVVVEEADETVLWLELLVDTAIISEKRMIKLLVEANELLAIFAASQHTARKKRVH